MRDRLSINISVARSCFVRCNGCYNHFGQSDKLVNTSTIIEFLKYAQSKGITKVTICGGDPLSRPDIISLLEEIKRLGFFINLDTVGTSIIGNVQTVFFGQNDIPKIDSKKLASLIDLIGIPVDGSTNEIATNFSVWQSTSTGRAVAYY